MTPKELAEKLRELTKCGPDHDGDYSGIEDTINELTFHNLHTILAALEAYEPWVSVTEALPEGDEIVLVATKSRFLAVRLVQIAGYGLWSHPDMTHWKPLPKPPEGE